MLEEIGKISLLYDFYGALLSDRQQEIMDLYYGENLSLAEIAQSIEISRQGVHDALKKSEKALEHYEEKLGLVQRFNQAKEAAAEIDRLITNLEQEEKLIPDLEKIRDLARKLGD